MAYSEYSFPLNGLLQYLIIVGFSLSQNLREQKEDQTCCEVSRC
jgi:hypothetical protein